MGLGLRCLARVRYRQELVPCVAHLETASDDSSSSSNSSSSSSGTGSDDRQVGGRLSVRFDVPLRAVAPGQAMVLYDGDICLGGTFIGDVGPSLYEQDRQVDPAFFD